MANSCVPLDKLITILVLLALPFGASSQSIWYRIDSLASQKVPRKIKNDVELLSAHLYEMGSNDAERARAVAIHIMNRFKYDRRDKGEDYQVGEMLSRKSVVCRHYAYLYKELCNKMGIRCEIVIGRVPLLPIALINFYKPWSWNAKHAWNAVYLDGKWHLVDLTWADTKKDNRRRGGVKLVEEKYYMANPKLILKTHLPENPMWQLLDYPISKETFLLHRRKRFSRPPRYDTIYSYNDTIDKIYGLPESERFVALAKDAKAYTIWGLNKGYQLAQSYLDAGDAVLDNKPLAERTIEDYEDAKYFYRMSMAYGRRSNTGKRAKRKIAMCDYAIELRKEES